MPGSYAVDTWGIRKAIGFGDIPAGVFGFTRGLFGDNYTWVHISTWGFCLSNPFVYNAFATSFWLLLATAACYGFFNMGGSSVTYQYAAELSYPAPEATSQGLLIWVGQISGVIFIYGLDTFRTASGAMTPFLMVMMALTLLVTFPMFGMKESAVIEKKTLTGFILIF